MLFVWQVPIVHSSIPTNIGVAFLLLDDNAQYLNFLASRIDLNNISSAWRGLDLYSHFQCCLHLTRGRF
jgi:hypothetical protein